MSMVEGFVTVDQATATWSGVGAALAVMNVLAPIQLARIATLPLITVPLYPLPGPYSIVPSGGPPPFECVLGVVNGAADQATAIASIIPYIQANGVAVASANSLGSGIPASGVDLPIF